MIPPGACAPKIPKGAYESYIHLQSIGCVPHLKDDDNAIGVDPACPVISSACGSEPPEDMLTSASNCAKDMVTTTSNCATEAEEKGKAPEQFYIGDDDDDAVEEVIPPPPRRDLFAEAQSLHHLMTHATYNPHCQACVRASLQRKHKRAKKNKTIGSMKGYKDVRMRERRQQHIRLTMTKLTRSTV